MSLAEVQGANRLLLPTTEPCPRLGLNKRILSPSEHYIKLKKCSRSINCVFRDPQVKVIFSRVGHRKWSRTRNVVFAFERKQELTRKTASEA